MVPYGFISFCNDLMQNLILVETEKLQYVSIPLMTNKKCREFWPFQLTENMLCAGFEKSSCFGDSGKATVKPSKWLILRLTKALSESANLRGLRTPVLQGIKHHLRRNK